MKLTAAKLEDVVVRAFVAANTSEPNARSVARALVQAEIDGQKGHGLTRVPSYTLQSRAGKIDGHAEPEVHDMRPGTIFIDANGGFAYPAVDRAVALLPECATKTGIAAAGITRSHHCGVLGRHVERLAEQGLVGLAFANTPDAMAPWGGQRRLFGTNPIAFAAPRPDAPPAVVDLALSQVARGKILSAAQKGEPIPAGWATDQDGRPTTDATKALSGTLLPIGDAKGAALAFMVEVLAVTLTGASFSFEASSFFDEKGGPPGVGQLFVAIDPDALAGRDTFLARMAVLCDAFDNNGEARLPGSRRLALRERARVDGVEVDAKTYDSLKALAGSS
jgi:(2R)-3-sulfolactate dehydrogenase (NADP+)